MRCPTSGQAHAESPANLINSIEGAEDPQARPGLDHMDGGPGADIVSYAQRTAPVAFDLTKPANASAGASATPLPASSRSSAGAGTIGWPATGRRNLIDGGPGRDALRGRAGADGFIRGGAVACGPGADTVIGGRAYAGVLAPDCELIDDTFGLLMDPHPVRCRPPVRALPRPVRHQELRDGGASVVHRDDRPPGAIRTAPPARPRRRRQGPLGRPANIGPPHEARRTTHVPSRPCGQLHHLHSQPLDRASPPRRPGASLGDPAEAPALVDAGQASTVAHAASRGVTLRSPSAA